MAGFCSNKYTQDRVRGLWRFTLTGQEVLLEVQVCKRDYDSSEGNSWHQISRSTSRFLYSYAALYVTSPKYEGSYTFELPSLHYNELQQKSVTASVNSAKCKK